jgi:hypothetical protein
MINLKSLKKLRILGAIVVSFLVTKKIYGAIKTEIIDDKKWLIDANKTPMLKIKEIQIKNEVKKNFIDKPKITIDMLSDHMDELPHLLKEANEVTFKTDFSKEYDKKLALGKTEDLINMHAYICDDKEGLNEFYYYIRNYKRNKKNSSDFFKYYKTKSGYEALESQSIYPMEYKLHFAIKPQYLVSFVCDFMRIFALLPSILICKFIPEFDSTRFWDIPTPVFVIYLTDISGTKNNKSKVLKKIIDPLKERYEDISEYIGLEYGDADIDTVEKVIEQNKEKKTEYTKVLSGKHSKEPVVTRYNRALLKNKKLFYITGGNGDDKNYCLRHLETIEDSIKKNLMKDLLYKYFTDDLAFFRRYEYDESYICYTERNQKVDFQPLTLSTAIYKLKALLIKIKDHLKSNLYSK